MKIKNLISFFRNLLKNKDEEQSEENPLKVTRKELLNTYLFSSNLNIHYKSKNYPHAFFLDKENIFAYHFVFSCIEYNKIDILNLICSIFSVEQTNDYMQAKGKNQNNEAIHFSIVPEFNAYTVRIVTNSIKLIESIDNLKIEPPPPWISFPEIDPDGLGALQGAIDYWWYVYWDVFWKELSKEERLEYYKKNNATSNWIEYIDFRYDFIINQG